MDAESGTILAARDPDRPRPVASLAKVMTAADAIERSHLDMPVTITEGDRVGEATAGLLIGDPVTIETLLQALLLPSGNDAAMALARAASGSPLVESEGARAQFITWMNEKAADRRARIPVAGDVHVPIAATYADLASVTWPDPAPGAPVTLWMSAGGCLADRPGLAIHGVVHGSRYPESAHAVASVFEAYLAQAGSVFDGALLDPPLYATGFPITPPFWVTARENRDYVDVMVQCFERRCLTYTPSHDPAWQVEMSIIGAHYLLGQEQSAQPALLGRAAQRRRFSGTALTPAHARLGKPASGRPELPDGCRRRNRVQCRRC